MDYSGSYQDALLGTISKRKREPSDYRDFYQSASARKKRKRSNIAEYTACSAQQQSIYQHNSLYSQFLSLPAEIRNEIYSYVLSNQVIHISVRECPRFDRASYTHADYYRRHKSRSRDRVDERNSFLKFTHTICTLPYDEEDRAYAFSRSQNLRYPNPPGDKETTSYRLRHKPCYRAIAHLKGNWQQLGGDVMVSPYFKQVSTPRLAVHFLQTCRQIYTEARDLVYTSNIFAFHEGDTAELFISKCLTSTQRNLISHIQLDGWMNDDYDPGCRTRDATLSQLCGLRSIQIAVNNGYTIHEAFRKTFRSLRPAPAQDYITPPVDVDEVGDFGVQNDKVRVTVDKTATGRYNALELERLVKRNAAVAFNLRADLIRLVPVGMR